MLFIAGVTSAISIIQPLISFCEDDLKFQRKKAIAATGTVTFLGSLVGIFGLAAGAVDELDFWGGSFLLVVLGTIQAFIFAFVLGRRKSDVIGDDGKPENEAFALMNDGAALKLPRFIRPIIMYVCPIYLAVVLVAWMIHDGMGVLLLSNVPADAKVTFLGNEFSQIGFTWGVRGFLFLLVILLNIAIYVAWRQGGTARLTTILHKQNKAIGNADERDEEEA